MDQEMSDSVKSRADEDHAERSVEEFERLSGQGDSVDLTFHREETHERKKARVPQRLKPGLIQRLKRPE